jgi:hypothetical protein
MAQQSAVEWLVKELMKNGVLYENATTDSMLFKQAKELERQQHGNTWDAAIKAHNDRGGVHARSLVDFDEWYEQQFKTK